MKVLITGASGLLGRAVFSEFENAKMEVIGTANKRANPPLKNLDLLNTDRVCDFIHTEKPDAIIHCAAERRPDVCENDRDGTVRLNAVVPGEIARLASQSGAWMVYISTDYVFDGTQAPYSTDAKPNPLNIYGQSKRGGEEAVRKESADACILRVPVLYGRQQSLEESPVTILSKDVLSGKEKKVDHWAIRFPTHTADVAAVLRQMAEYRIAHPDFRGTCHWSGNESFTKYEMAVVIGELLCQSTDYLVPDPNPASGAPRPKNCQLDCSDLEKLGIGKRTPFREGILPIISEIIK